MYWSSIQDSSRRWFPGFPHGSQGSPFLHNSVLTSVAALISPACRTVAGGGSQGSPMASRVPRSYLTQYLLVLQHWSAQPAGQRQEVDSRVPPFLHDSVLTSVAACIGPACRTDSVLTSVTACIGPACGTAAGGGSQGSPWLPGFPHSYMTQYLLVLQHVSVQPAGQTQYLLVLQHVSVQPAGQQQEVAPRVPHGSHVSPIPTWLSTY